jgi:predicted AlkP superfamily phosphohydrolase/phosphomutase
MEHDQKHSVSENLETPLMFSALERYETSDHAHNLENGNLFSTPFFLAPTSKRSQLTQIQLIYDIAPSSLAAFASEHGSLNSDSHLAPRSVI